MNALFDLLPARSKDAHKGNFGHVLVIGGNSGMAGAAILSGLGAARAGAGLVTLATHADHAAFLNVVYPGLMCYGIKKVSQLEPLIKKATVIAIGPGLGQDRWAQTLLNIVLKLNSPMIIDADALNLLVGRKIEIKKAILTPHPGEAARLLKKKVSAIQNNRMKMAILLQKKFKSVVVLKGAGTLVVDKNERCFLCKAGNPGLAVGGMGDLLTGLIAGLVAQGLDLFDAARLGVELHALTADHMVSKQGERGLSPLELLNSIPLLINKKVKV